MREASQPGTGLARVANPGTGRSSLRHGKPRHQPEPLTIPSPQAQGDSSPRQDGAGWREYAVALTTVAAVSGLNLWLQKWVGYEAVALVYLLAVMLLALGVSRGPILFGTALTALSYNFLFVPPRYSLGIERFYDKMMLAMYFFVALTVGQLTARLRAQRFVDKKREEELREAEINSRLLGESERLGRTLLNSVSHELRTPLAAITTGTNSLRAAGPLTPTQQNLTAEIESAAGRLNRVVQGLLSAARLQAGQLKPTFDWCDISELVRVTLREAAPWLAGHLAQTQIAPDLPLLKADFVLLEQALNNLVVNAAVHTPADTVIDIKARIEGRWVVLEVADNGPGLAREQLERAFEMFQRGPDTKPGGAGLGLAIVKGLIEAQGGHVRAANRPGGGALFTLYLPVPEAPNAPPEAL